MRAGSSGLHSGRRGSHPSSGIDDPARPGGAREGGRRRRRRAIGMREVVMPCARRATTRHLEARERGHRSSRRVVGRVVGRRDGVRVSAARGSPHRSVIRIGLAAGGRRPAPGPVPPLGATRGARARAGADARRRSTARSRCGRSPGRRRGRWPRSAGTVVGAEPRSRPPCGQQREAGRRGPGVGARSPGPRCNPEEEIFEDALLDESHHSISPNLTKSSRFNGIFCSLANSRRRS